MNLIIPNNLNQITDNINLIDGVILSIKGFSVNSIYQITLNDLDDILPLLKTKEVFISINKNIENSEICKLEDILLKLNNYPIKGVLYSDVALVTYKEKLNYDLVYAQEHLTTNYETINYWYSKGVNYTYLSSDITLKEINEIRANTSIKLMANIFGYVPIFTSKRHIVKNYLNTFNIKDNSKINYIKKEGKIYPIVDSDYTYVFSDTILNAINEYYKMKVDYFVINGFLIQNLKFHNLLEIISHINEKNISECNEKINKMFPNTSSLFLYQETVSRVR